MPNMENTANGRRHHTAPRNRIFEDVGTEEKQYAQRAALQQADRILDIRKEKALRAQEESAAAKQEGELATVAYQIAPTFANHEKMQQAQVAQMQALRGERHAAEDMALAKADLMLAENRFLQEVRHDSLLIDADFRKAAEDSSPATDEAQSTDAQMLALLAQSSAARAKKAYHEQMSRQAMAAFADGKTDFEQKQRRPEHLPPSATQEKISAPPRILEQSVGSAPLRAAHSVSPRERLVQTDAPYVTDAELPPIEATVRWAQHKGEAATAAKEKYEEAVHRLAELNEKISAGRQTVLLQSRAYREEPSEKNKWGLNAVAKQYQALLLRFFLGCQNLESLKNTAQSSNAESQKATESVAKLQELYAYQKDTVRPQEAIEADLRVLEREITDLSSELKQSERTDREDAKARAAALMQGIEQRKALRAKKEEELSKAKELPLIELQERDDYEELGKYQKESKDGTTAEPWYFPLYEALNGNSDARDYLKYMAAYGENAPYYASKEAYIRGWNAYAQDMQLRENKLATLPDTWHEIAYATEEQKQLFNAVYHKYGKEAAERFYTERLRDELMLQHRKAREAEWSETATKNVGAGIFATLATVLGSPAKGAAYIGQLADYVQDGKIEENAMYNDLSRMNTTTRAAILKEIENSGKWGKAGGVAYGIVTSIADFVWQMFLSSGISTAASSAALAKKLAETIKLTFTGTGSASDGIIDAKDRGLTDEQALLLGTILGAAEIFTEKFSLDALYDKGAGDSTWKYILNNMLTEASEEVVSDAIHFAADELIAKGQSRLQTAIDAYQTVWHKSEREATLAAWKDLAGEVGMDALGGAISGGILSGIGAGYDAVAAKKARNASYSEAGKALRRCGDDTVERMLRGAQTMQAETDVKKLASRLSAKQAAGKPLSDAEVGALFYAILREKGRLQRGRPFCLRTSGTRRAKLRVRQEIRMRQGGNLSKNYFCKKAAKFDEEIDRKRQICD